MKHNLHYTLSFDLLMWFRPNVGVWSCSGVVLCYTFAIFSYYSICFRSVFRDYCSDHYWSIRAHVKAACVFFFFSPSCRECWRVSWARHWREQCSACWLVSPWLFSAAQARCSSLKGSSSTSASELASVSKSLGRIGEGWSRVHKQ